MQTEDEEAPDASFTCHHMRMPTYTRSWTYSNTDESAVRFLKGANVSSQGSGGEKLNLKEILHTHTTNAHLRARKPFICFFFFFICLPAPFVFRSLTSFLHKQPNMHTTLPKRSPNPVEEGKIKESYSSQALGPAEPNSRKTGNILVCSPSRYRNRYRDSDSDSDKDNCHEPVELLYVPGEHSEHDETPAESSNTQWMGINI